MLVIMAEGPARPARRVAAAAGHADKRVANHRGGVVSEVDDPPQTIEASARATLLDAASRRGRQVHKSTAFDVIVGVGLVTYGIVHLLIAWIAVRIAWTGRGNDSQDAALAALAETVYGEALLWITAVRPGRAHPVADLRDDLAPGTRGGAGSTGRSVGPVRCSARRLPDVGSARPGWRWSVAPPGGPAHRRQLHGDRGNRAPGRRGDHGVVLIVIAVRAIYRGIRRRFRRRRPEGLRVSRR